VISREATLQAKAWPRPLETDQRAEADYGAVAFRGGQLRDILATPSGAQPDPTVAFLAQCYTCGTVEGANAEHPDRGLAQGRAARGIAAYLIEKSSTGDSLGAPHCLTSDFDTALDTFRTGLAPLLAAERGNLKGVAVLGAALREWHDYMIDPFRLQAFYNRGEDAVELAALAEDMRPLLDRIFPEEIAPTRIAEEPATHAPLLRTVLQRHGKDTIPARMTTFRRGIGQQCLTKAFRDARAPVLTMEGETGYGEADFAAIDDHNHRLIAEIVNPFRPGRGAFIMLPKTGHGFGVDATREEARAGNITRDQPIKCAAPYNHAVHKTLATWIEGLPVRR
jgi:hypothetical protein